MFFFFSSRRRHTRFDCDWSSDVCSSDLDESAGRPFFLFAHYFDVHYEYLDHAEFPWSDGYEGWLADELDFENLIDRKSTRLNSSHSQISYAVFCLKKKKTENATI